MYGIVRKNSNVKGQRPGEEQPYIRIDKHGQHALRRGHVRPDESAGHNQIHGVVPQEVPHRLHRQAKQASEADQVVGQTVSQTPRPPGPQQKAECAQWGERRDFDGEEADRRRQGQVSSRQQQV
jgi:hypothetical protein